MPPIGVLALLAGDMALGKTGYADGEIPLLADKAHQLAGELEAAGRGLELSPAGRIAAQGQEVLHSESANAP